MSNAELRARLVHALHAIKHPAPEADGAAMYYAGPGIWFCVTLAGGFEVVRETGEPVMTLTPAETRALAAFWRLMSYTEILAALDTVE